MIQDVPPRDITKIVDGFIRLLYKPSIELFNDEIRDIATANQQLRQSPLFTFRFRGVTYRLDNGEVRYPQTLHPSLSERMGKLVERRTAVLEHEAAYVRQALISACSISESATHLYELLPEVCHKRLQALGITSILDSYFQPLPEKVVMAFRTNQKVNLDKIDYRETKNLLGIIQ